MSSNIFRIFKPGAETREEREQKRKAQLRHAQKTYRNRKEHYTAALESQLAVVRASEARLLTEVQTLRQKVEALQECIRNHGLAISEPYSVTVFSHNDSIQSQVYPQVDGNSNQHSSRPPLREHKGKPSSKPHVPGTIQSGVTSAAVRTEDADFLALGMEFVLTIESPCLPHLHNTDHPDEASCHALTISAHLTAAYPELPISTQLVTERATLCQQVPEGMLDVLLRLSEVLCPADHVTPVQAWRHIRSQPQFGALSTKDLQTLAEILRDAVECHGFGAVVGKKLFTEIVCNYLTRLPYI